MGKGSVNDMGIYQSVRRGDIKDESNKNIGRTVRIFKLYKTGVQERAKSTWSITDYGIDPSGKGTGIYEFGSKRNVGKRKSYFRERRNKPFL